MKYNLDNMMALDIYLSAMNNYSFNGKPTEIQQDTLTLPIMSWDIYSQANSKNVFEAKRLQDIAKIKLLASQFNWQDDINSIFEKENFEAIIVTDINQKILWVNHGFSQMTGFKQSEALYKTPKFLQGAKTSLKTKQRIREKLNTNLPFKEVIVNHKKDGTPYKCEVKIFPLYGKGSKTHYLALERQVS